MKRDACMKPAFYFGSLYWGLAAPSLLHRVNRDRMGIHGNQQEILGISGFWLN
jgi:hypothetical protein